MSDCSGSIVIPVEMGVQGPQVTLCYDPGPQWCPCPQMVVNVGAQSGTTFDAAINVTCGVESDGCLLYVWNFNFTYPGSAGGGQTFTGPVTYTNTATITNQGAPTTYTANTIDTINAGVTLTLGGSGNFVINAPLTLGCSLNYTYESVHVFAAELDNYQLTCKTIQTFSASSSNLLITGFIPFDATRAETHFIVNTGSNSFILANLNSSSSAANRFYCPGNVNAIISPQEMCCIVYDPPSSGWYVWGNWPVFTDNAITLTAGANNNVQLTADIVQQLSTTNNNSTISGFIPYDITKAEYHVLENVSVYPIIITNQDPGSTGTYQIYCPGLINAPLAAKNKCTIVYDPTTTNKWFLGDNYIPATPPVIPPYYTIGTFTCPAVGAIVTLPFAVNTTFQIGQTIVVYDGSPDFYFLYGVVTSIAGSGTAVTVRTTSIVGVSAGQTFATASAVSPSGDSQTVEGALPPQVIAASGGGSGGMEVTQVNTQTFYKQVMIELTALNGTASATFATPFSLTPAIITTSGTTGLSAGLITALSTTSVTVTATGQTGYLFLEGN